MSIENVTTIAGLTDSWPIPGDPISEGDDHLRLIKRVLKKQFTGGLAVGPGQGLNAPVTVSATEMNYLLGARSNIQEQIDAITGGNGIFPPGTVMLFAQPNPPPGWVQDTTSAVDNKMILTTRFGPGASSGGTVGGSHAPNILVWDHIHTTAGFALTTANIPPHNHEMFKDAESSTPLGGTSGHVAAATGQAGVGDFKYEISSAGVYSGSNKPTIGVSGPGINTNGTAHSHGNTGQVSGVATSTWQPTFLRVINCMRDTT